MIAIAQIPEILTKESSWEENYALFQKLLEEHGQAALKQDSAEFWLVTADPKLNQWLVYTRIELKKSRRQNDQQWLDRKERLEQLGIQF